MSDINSMGGILERLGLSYEDLNEAEKATLTGWVDGIAKKDMDIDDVREHIRNMIYAVEAELADTEEFTWVFIWRVVNPKSVSLRARLKNYVMLEAFMSTPDKARSWMEQHLQQLAKKV